MIYAIILFLFMISLLIYAFLMINGKFSELNITQAKKLDKEKFFDYIIDVRSKNEFEKKHHPNAINIPLNDLENLLPIKVPDRKKFILFYCKEGIRASGALDIAKNLGYKKIYYLDDLSSDFFFKNL